MNNIKIIKTLFVGTLLSILVFFSISFITVLIQINPLHYYKIGERYKLNIGFPFKYYEQFWVRGSDIPNSGWIIENLFYNCVITWIIVTAIFYVSVKKNII